MAAITPVPVPESLTRARAFIDARSGLQITIDGVASEIGVSPRALQLSFRRHLDTTPMEYARGVRIAHAHRELRAAVPGPNTSVTRIALDWGFTNPSRFASYYRAAYGQSPHKTLQS